MKETTVNGTRYTLKQCEVVRFEDEFGHSYTINDEPVAGVTTLLGMGMPVETGLLEYFKRTDKETQEEILADAQDRGSNVHHAIEALLYGKTVESESLRRKREKLAIAAFVDFFTKVQLTDIHPEEVIAYLNGDIKFAGTLDLRAKLVANGQRIIIDFKTSAAHSRKNELQVTAYKKASEQSTGQRVDDCYVLYLGTSHKGLRFKVDDNGIPNCGVGWFIVKVDTTFQDFLLAYKMALFMNKGEYPKPPKTVVFPEKWKILEPKKETI